MPSTTGFEFGEVVLVPFPFSDQSAVKKRPAVVVSSDAYHSERPDLIILAITSRHREDSDVEILDWRDAGLLKASVMKPVLATIEKGLVLRKLGQLTDQDLGSLRSVLRTILGVS